MEDWKAPDRVISSMEELRGILEPILRKLDTITFEKGFAPPLRKITELLLPIAEWLQDQDNLGDNEQFIEFIKSDTQYEKIKLFLALYADVYTLRNKFPEPSETPYLEKLRQAALLFNSLAKVIYNTRRQIADRSVESEFAPYQDERGFEDYHKLLFFDVASGEFETYLRNSPPGLWLDVGSGNTYRNPDSLMSRLRTLNPGIQLLGIDPTYNPENARPINLLYGTATVDRENPLSQNLTAGTGQRLPYENSVFKKVLIAHVLEWMNQPHQIGQILRQAARVLIAEGELRLTSLPAELLNEPTNPLNHYFEIVKAEKRENHLVTADLKKTETTAYDIIARKKILSGAQKLQLQREIDNWLEAYPEN